jgi:D-hydroxyproline dehydrogenase subunit alpha
MSQRERRDLVVVGGGLAGLSATTAARRAGLDTCLVEQRSALRGPRTLVARARSSGAELCLETLAWGIWGREVAVCSAAGPTRTLVADQVILATGAYERPVAFPGWNLPGVMTAGGAMGLLAQGVSPGKRVLVAGYGQWVQSAADDLRAAGVQVLDVIDAAARPGRLVVRAEGEATLRRAVVARVDAEWRPRPGTERIVDVDTLVLAFGYLPENQLARLAGCQQTGSEYVGPRTVRDAWLRSSVPGILVAGDAGGIVGWDAALLQGRLAGLAAAVDAGHVHLADAEPKARAIQRRLRGFRAATATADAPRPGVYALAEPTTLICRCEDVSSGEIADRLFGDSFEPGPVIAESRAGMGSCQGRNCASLIAATISRHAGQALDRIPAVTPRPPAVLVPLGALAERPPEFEPLADLTED